MDSASGGAGGAGAVAGGAGAEPGSDPAGGGPAGGAEGWAPNTACDEPSSATVRAYFEVPGAADGTPGDFFRLPFPSDVLAAGGQLDLDGFPTPGPGLLGYDLVARYVDAVELAGGGWSGSPTVIFRFSGPLDVDRLAASTNRLAFVDVTAGTAEYGTSVPAHHRYTEPSGHYVCHDWLGIRPVLGARLLAGHTYAVWLPADLRARDGSAIERSSHLVEVLADAVPGAPELGAAHAAFLPLRSYLADPSVTAPTTDEILDATVFTVGPILDPMTALARALEAASMPVASSWVRCEPGAVSPCPQASPEENRACGTGTDAYDEYHALVELPVFQVGVAPYLESGGDIDPTAPVRHESVCLALTVPTGAMPSAGWPLVVHAHGNGGSFRWHARDAVAGTLSRVVTGSGEVRFAVLGIDQVQHGPRRGDSTLSPDVLYANWDNPDAARGNPLQGAADQLALARLVGGLEIPAAATGGPAVRTDPDRVVFWGHSQGATVGSLALPQTDVYRAAVLSGHGGSLVHSLLTKTSPVELAAVLPLAVDDLDADRRLPGGEFHPVLALIQQFIDPADPLHHGRLIGVEPLPGRRPKHVLQVFGIGDTFSPPVTMAAYALAAGLSLAQPDSSVTSPFAIGDPAVEPSPDLPLGGNALVGSEPVTLVVRQYAPGAGVDGHFVATQVPAANADVARFLALAALGEVPEVGQ